MHTAAHMRDHARACTCICAEGGWRCLAERDEAELEHVYTHLCTHAYTHGYAQARTHMYTYANTQAVLETLTKIPFSTYVDSGRRC